MYKYPKAMDLDRDRDLRVKAVQIVSSDVDREVA